MRQFLALAVLLPTILLGMAGCSNPSPFSWKVAGNELVNEGYGIAFLDLPPSFRVTGGKDWSDTVLLQATSGPLGASAFLSVHPLREGEALPEFARTTIRSFAEHGSLIELRQDVLESPKVKGWRISFQQELQKSDPPRTRCIGLYPRAGKVFMLSFDSSSEKAAENLDYFELALLSVRFLGNPTTEEPTLRGARARYHWFERDGRLWNAGYHCSLPFSFDDWVPTTTETNITGGVVLTLGAPARKMSRLVEWYRAGGEPLGSFIGEHLADLRKAGTLEEIGRRSWESPDGNGSWVEVRFRNRGTSGEDKDFLYWYLQAAGEVYVLSQSLPRSAWTDALWDEFPAILRREPEPVEPDPLSQAFLQAYANFQTGQFDAAEGWFTATLAQQSGYAPGLWGVGMVAFERRQYSRAADKLGAALAANALPRALEESAWQRLGPARLNIRQPKLALEAFVRLAELSPGAALPYFLQAQVHATLADAKGAEAALRQCLLRARADGSAGQGSTLATYLELTTRDPSLQFFSTSEWMRSLRDEFGGKPQPAGTFAPKLR